MQGIVLVTEREEDPESETEEGDASAEEEEEVGDPPEVDGALSGNVDDRENDRHGDGSINNNAIWNTERLSCNRLHFHGHLAQLEASEASKGIIWLSLLFDIRRKNVPRAEPAHPAVRSA